MSSRYYLFMYFFYIATISVHGLKIGALFLESEHQYAVSTFEAAVNMINHRLIAANSTIEQASTVYVDTVQPYILADKLYEIRNAGIDVLIAPPDREAAKILDALSTELGIILMKYFWISDSCEESTSRSSSLNVFPSQQYLLLLQRLISYWNWERIVLVFSKNSSCCRFKSLLEKTNIEVILLEVDVQSTFGFLRAGKMLRVICDRSNCWRNTNRLLVDLTPLETHRFLQAALMLGMINLRNWYLITSLDSVHENMGPYSHNMMRLGIATVWNEKKVIELLHENRQYYDHFIDRWKDSDPYQQHFHIPYREFSLLFDAVLVACYLKRSYDRNYIKSPTLNQQFTYSNWTIHDGLSGQISFDETGERLHSEALIWELGIDGVPVKTGFWSTGRTNEENKFYMLDKDLPNTHERVLRERKTQRLLIVSSVEEKPYIMKRTRPNGDIEYEGFCVDLLDRLAERLDFDYKIQIVSDAKYGEPINGTKQWNGIIGEILRGQADMAVAPITVTAGRLEVVDFTDPFLQLGISMLMRQPNRRSSSSLTSFLWPLSGSIWLYSAFAAFGTALSVIVVSILSPSESNTEFNVTNSFWYLICILLRAGSGYNCQSTSNRLISTIWWLFTLVLIAQYTANFAAVLTVDRKSIPFNSFEELGNQTEYNFGSILGGSTMQFFKYSRLDTFRRIWERMANTTPSVFVVTNSEGVQRVLNEKYVFLMESSSLEYQLGQNCNLSRVGTVVLGSNGYSIALPKGSKWREKLSRQILDFHEKGIIMLLKDKWWKKTSHDEDCEEPVETHKSLGMEKVSGLFLLLGFGICSAVLFSFFERLLFVLKVMRSYKKH